MTMKSHIGWDSIIHPKMDSRDAASYKGFSQEPSCVKECFLDASSGG